MRRNSTEKTQAQLLQQQKLQRSQAAPPKEGSSVGVPVISRPGHASGFNRTAKQIGGLMGSTPGGVHQKASLEQLRKMKQEIQNLRDANVDLKDALHEARQDFLLVRQERDIYRAQASKFKQELASFDSIVQMKVAKALELNNVELKQKVEAQAAEIAKVKDHNRCFKETIDFLEGQLRNTKEDLNKASYSLMQSYGQSRGPNLAEMLRKNEEESFKKDGGFGIDNSDESLDRDETQLNQQDSEPTPIGLTLFRSKQQKSSSNAVAPYNPSSFDDDAKVKKQLKESRYVYKDEEVDFSRDDLSGGEDIGIGEDEDCRGVLFDDQDLFGDKNEVKTMTKNNKTKMMLDELEGGGGDTDHSFRQATNMDDEMGALNSDRLMVPSSSGQKKRSNGLTKSLALPNSSTKDGSGDKSVHSGGILGLSGINLDFRKSRDGLKSFFQKSNQGVGISSSIQFTQLDKH